MAEPLVSFLIPAHNAGRWIGATLESVLAQTWPAREVIVVDDGSTDATVDAIARFESRGVRLVQQPKSGAAAARNRAFAAAMGDFIQFIDADDLIAPDKTARQIAILARHEPGCVAACEWARFHDDDTATAVFMPEGVWADLDPVEWLVRSWTGGGMMHGAAWLIPRKVAELAGPWDERLSLIDDFEYFTRLLLASRSVTFCAGARTFYRSGLADSLSRASSPSAWESAFLALRLGTAALLEKEDSASTRRAAATVFQRFAFEVFAHAPHLSADAEDRARELGGCGAAPSGGPMFLALTRLVGWKRASVIRARAYRLGYADAIGSRAGRLIRGWRPRAS